MMTNIQTLMTILQCDHPSWILLQIRKVLVLIPTVLIQILLLCLLTYLFCLLYQSMNNKLQKIKLFRLLVGISIINVFWYAQNQLLEKKIAFVVKESAFVYAGPEQSFHTILQLKSGTCVQLLKCQSSMCQISLNGQQGWVELQDLKIQ